MGENDRNSCPPPLFASNLRQTRMSRRQKRESGIVGGLAALAIRAKSYVMEGRQDLPVPANSANGSTVKTSAGNKLDPATNPSGTKNNCEDSSMKRKNNKGEEGKEILNKIDGKETRQAVSYKKCHKTQKKSEMKATQSSESTAETTKESQKESREENKKSNAVQSKGGATRFKKGLLEGKMRNEEENQNTLEPMRQ